MMRMSRLPGPEWVVWLVLKMLGLREWNLELISFVQWVNGKPDRAVAVARGRFVFLDYNGVLYDGPNVEMRPSATLVRYHLDGPCLTFAFSDKLVRSFTFSSEEEARSWAGKSAESGMTAQEDSNPNEW